MIKRNLYLPVVGSLALLAFVLVVFMAPPPPTPGLAFDTPAGPQSLPGRASVTPPVATFSATPSISSTPPVTSIFSFPTAPPTGSATPQRQCTDLFPIENIEAIAFGETTLIQLEARFGRAVRESGRANWFRFEAAGCVTRALIGVQETLEVELYGYGTLAWLLTRYGRPQSAGISQGNLTLRDIGHTILFYPEAGILAEFASAPAMLEPETPLVRLTFRPPFEVERQMKRLNALAVEWSPPVSWYRAGSPTPEVGVQ